MRRLVLSAAFLLSVSAWAKEPPQDPAKLVATHGYAFVHAPKGGLTSMLVQPASGGKGGDSIDTAAPTAARLGEEAFGKWLPEGEYRIIGWGGNRQEEGPVFKVEAGRATHIGAFVPINVGGYQLVLMPTRHEEDAGALERAIEPFRALLRDPEPIRTDIPTVPAAITLQQPPSGLGLIVDLLMRHERKVNRPSSLQRLKETKDAGEFLMLARTVMPPLQDEPALEADGTAWFPADLGQLRRRAPDGQWDSVGIGTLRQILAVEYDQGRLVTGSDDGKLRASTDRGQTWTLLRALAAEESVIDIDKVDGRWLVVTTRRFSDAKADRGGGLVAAMPGTQSVAMRVYMGSGDDLSDLAVSREFTLSPKGQMAWFGARGQGFGNRYFIQAGTALQRLDLATDTWTTITPGPRVGSHRVDPQTGTLAALWSQGAFSKLYVSTDGGDNWAQIKRPPYVIFDVQMASPEEGWASRMNMGAFSGTWETWGYVPARKDWAKTGEAPGNCKPMRYAPNAAPICITTGASILGLRDGEWEVEFAAN